MLAVGRWFVYATGGTKFAYLHFTYIPIGFQVPRRHLLPLRESDIELTRTQHRAACEALRGEEPRLPC